MEEEQNDQKGQTVRGSAVLVLQEMLPAIALARYMQRAHKYFCVPLAFMTSKKPLVKSHYLGLCSPRADPETGISLGADPRERW